MKVTKGKRNIVLVLASLFLLAALPVMASAQGRGRGRGQDKKLDKFVNGHDARDGRWDGRGPRATRVRYRNYRRHNVYMPQDWRWGVDRAGDGDVDRYDYRRARRHNRTGSFEQRRRVYFRRR